MYGSASPKGAIGPVRGLTWPILITRDCALTGMTLRIAGAASAPRLVLMRVRRSRRRSLIRYLLMAAPGDRVSGSPEGRDEVYHIPAPARCGEAGRDPASSELLQVLHQQQAPLRPQDLG